MRLFIFQNNTNADLIIPKNKGNGNITLKKDDKFIGEESYFSYVKPPLNLLKFVEEVNQENYPEEVKKQINKENTEQKKYIEVKEINKNESNKKELKKEKIKTKNIDKKEQANKKKKEKNMKEQKLILEQPDKIETKQENDDNLNEEMLLTEQPSGEVEIINEEENKN